MKPKLSKIAFALVLAVTASAAQSKKLDTAQIDELTGLKGKLNEQEGVYKVSSPRTDLKISVDRWEMPPFMGLTSWAAFMPGMKDGVMVMGDLVLMQDEVNPVMSAALNAGLQVTALHNHFFFDEPKVYFMHIGGDGPLAQLAQGVRTIFDTGKEIRIKTPMPADSFGSGQLPAKSTIDGGVISQVFGQKGDAKEGMYKVTIGRVVQMAGMDIGNTMGVNTWAEFDGTSEDALVVGDFAVLENELRTVLK